MTESYSNASVSSSSSLNSSFPDTEDDQTIASILAEEGDSQVAGRLGKRLSHLDSIPELSRNCSLDYVRQGFFNNFKQLYNISGTCFYLTPRVNGEIPDVNDATLDHERLSERLATYGLEELKIEGDGNCQFRALADQLFRSPDYHKHARKQIVKQLKHHRKLYEGYVPMKYRSYVKKMKKSGEWGDHVTLQAAADRFGAKICVLTSFRDTCYIEIFPKDRSPTREIWLSFWSEVHYNSLYEIGDVPTRVGRKKYWFF